MPEVLNQRTAGERGKSAVYIGRGSKWGNPYPIGDRDRDEVCEMYEAHLRTRVDLLNALDELRGRDLVCHCAPERCHGDLLLRLANAPLEERLAWWNRS